MADAAELRRSMYLIVIGVATAIAAARVASAENMYDPSRYKPPAGKDGAPAYGKEPDRVWPSERPDPTPMFSSNDKSRWATVRCLVDEGTYAIGSRYYPDGANPKVFTDSGVVAEPQFKSLDIVLRPLGENAEGPQTRHFYSSKPPLLPTLIAGEYWALKQAFGWDIVRDRFLVIPAILFTVNVVPFAIYLLLTARLVEGIGRTDFGRLLALASAAIGTFVLTFMGTLNNHTPAAFCVLFSAYPLVRAMSENRAMGPIGFLACGFFAGFAATFELPAAAYLAGVGAPLLIARPRQTLLFFLPAAALPIAALFVCNYVALGQWLPAYSEFGGPWYNFEGSHWAKRGTPAARGIDFSDEPTVVYAFHLLFGHHGWFSLTPIWLLALAGLLALALRSASDIRRLFQAPKGSLWTPALFAAMTLVVSLVVFAYFLTRTQNYNYGGFTSGPRWLFWLIPLWVLGVAWAADRVAPYRLGRAACVLLLGLSVFSVFYPAINPWRAPWILQLMEFTGYLHY